MEHNASNVSLESVVNKFHRSNIISMTNKLWKLQPKLKLNGHLLC